MQSQQEEERSNRRHHISWKRLIILLSLSLFYVVITIVFVISGQLSITYLTITVTIWATVLVFLIPTLQLFLPRSSQRSTASNSPTSSQHPTTSNNELEDKSHPQDQLALETNSKAKSEDSTTQANNKKSISIAREQRNQFNVDRQQTYMTLLVALQILAFGVLLFAFTETTALTNPGQSYFYLPHFASFLILLTILSTINLKVWRLSVLQIALLHFLTIFEIIAFRFFNNLFVWFFCIAFVFILESIFQFMNSFYKSKDYNITKAPIISILRNSFSLKIIIYLVFGILFLLLDLVYNLFIRSAYYSYQYISTNLGFFGFSILLILILLVLENISFQPFKRQKQENTYKTVSDDRMSNSSVIRLRIVEEPLTAFNLTTILTALTELNTKCWLIQQNRMAELIEYTQTHDIGFIEEANLVITKLSRNSPADIGLETTAEPDPQARTQALKIAVTEQFTPIKEKIARLDNHAREIGKQLEELKTQPALSTKVQSQRLEVKEAELKELEKRLENENQQLKLELELLQIERQRLEIQEMRLDYEKKRVDYALDIAAKMLNLLCPNANQEAREVQLRTLLPNLLQLGNGKGVELLLSPTKQEDTSVDDDKLIDEDDTR